VHEQHHSLGCLGATLQAGEEKHVSKVTSQ
jgi:hypothetical protein